MNMKFRYPVEPKSHVTYEFFLLFRFKNDPEVFSLPHMKW